MNTDTRVIFYTKIYLFYKFLLDAYSNNNFAKRLSSGLTKAKSFFLTVREKHSLSVLFNSSPLTRFKNNSFCLGEKIGDNAYSKEKFRLTS